MNATKCADIAIKCYDRIQKSPVPLALFKVRDTVKATRAGSDLYATAEKSGQLVGIYDHDCTEQWIYDDVYFVLRGVQ